MRLPLKTFPCLILITLILSCRKEIKLTPDSAGSTTLASTPTNCKPVGLGLLVNIPNEPQQWYNLMLKWYGPSGKLSHLKAFIEELLGQNLYFPAFKLDYGEVIYDNDMVYLKDVYSDKIILKVKLDAAGRPITSWFDGLYHNIPMTDTTYLYYNSSGRLDSITRTYLIGTSPPHSILSTKYLCEYDISGNIIHLTQPTGRVNFKYDYAQANPGIIPHYVVSIPLKLLEYLELLQFPHYNLLTSANSGVLIPGYPDDTYPVFQWNWYSPQTNSTGQIYYYEDGIGYPDRGIFYSAWDCNNSTMFQSENPTQKEFMKLIKK